MSVELLYTSAPQGLKSGSRGFCTVVSTAGMPINLAMRLEALSAYRHVYAPQDPSAHLNPVGYSHLKTNVGGRALSILSRFAAYGVDYSQRTNKLVHHIVLEPNERGESGPAAVLQSNGFFDEEWNGVCRTPATGPDIPALTVTAEICRTWETIQGDAGWAGVVAECFATPTAKPLWIVFSVEQSKLLLTLLAESVALLPPSQRWNATFSTYYTNLPPDIDCKVRCVLAGTDEARLARARGTVIVLGDNTEAPETAFTIAARSGSPIVGDFLSPGASVEASLASPNAASEFAPSELGVSPASIPKSSSASQHLTDALTLGPPAARSMRSFALPPVPKTGSKPPRVVPWLQIACGGGAVLALLTVVAMLVNPIAETIGQGDQTDKVESGEAGAGTSGQTVEARPDVAASVGATRAAKIDQAAPAPAPAPVKLNAKAVHHQYTVLEGGAFDLKFRVDQGDPNTKISVMSDRLPFSVKSPANIAGNVASWNVAAPTKAGTYTIACTISAPHTPEELVAIELVVKNSQPTLAVDPFKSEYDPNEPILLSGSWTNAKIDPSDQVYLFAQTLNSQQRPSELKADAELTAEGKWRLAVPFKALNSAESIRIGIDDREGGGPVFSNPIKINPRRSRARLNINALSVGKIIFSATVDCNCERRPRSYSVGAEQQSKTFPIAYTSNVADEGLQFEIQNGTWNANKLSLDLRLLGGTGLPEALRLLLDKKDDARAISEKLAQLRGQTEEAIQEVSEIAETFDAKTKAGFLAIKAEAMRMLKRRPPSLDDIIKRPDNVQEAIKACQDILDRIKGDVNKWPISDEQKKAAIGRLSTVLQYYKETAMRQASLVSAIEQVYGTPFNVQTNLTLWAPDGADPFSAKRQITKEIPDLYLLISKDGPS
jgi:hypothetical protein